MGNKIETSSCEIVGDLLPLYVDGACSKESENIVEKHLKDCPYCTRLFEQMTAPFAFPEPSPKEIKIQKAFKKIWFSFLAGVAVLAVVVITVTVTDCIQFHIPSRDGMNETNWNEIKKVEEVMQTWKEVGIEKAVDLMKPMDLYFDLSEDLTDAELNEWTGQFFLEEAFTYQNFEVAKEKYAVVLYSSDDSNKQYLPWECYVTEEGVEWETPLTVAGLEMKNALDAKDFVSFWHIFMKEYQEEGVIVTEDIYKKVTEQYKDIDKTSYHRMEVASGVYYYYDKIDENHVGILYHDFPKTMYEKLENIEPMKNEFFIYADNKYMPEVLCLEFMEAYKQVRSYFDAYTKYYQELGYYKFADQWREQIKTTIKQLEKQGIVLESYEIDYEDGIFSPDNPDYYGLRVICKATFSNGKAVYLYFDVNNGRCVLDDVNAVYWEGITKEEKEELEQFVDFIWQALDYRMIVVKN